ncbi:putative RDD family membrane protein YckC [Conyzicola lurida]|uniref:Putative RDD family membrane protein YckC n=1 Tax=Conyzicola lurida TaxID=1172621 RepID=A0A841ANJ0_9MICO|nr:putative RDD family membrane protein YckC [Conyzicola lurida]
MSFDGLGVLPAPLGRRALSFAVDAAIVAIAAIPAFIGYPLLLAAALAGDTGSGPVPLVLVIVGVVLADAVVIVQLVLHGLRGITVGKKLLGLRSVNVDTLEKPGFWRVVLRAIVLGASSIVPVAGPAVLLASPLWASNAQKRGWLDAVSRSVLVDARLGVDPYDATAMREARKARDRANAEPAPEVPSLATGTGAPTPFAPGTRSRSSIVGGAPATGALAEAAPATADPAGPVAPATPPAVPSTPATGSVGLPPGFGQAAAATPAAEALLLGENGLRYALKATAVIGRNPVADPAKPEAASIIVADETFSMSKTHARLELDADGVWVTDLSSSNGTAAVDTAGASSDLTAGTPAHVAWGGTVRFGDRVFTVHQSSSF